MVDFQNHLKNYTSLKFWLKNILSLWSWGLLSDIQWVYSFLWLNFDLTCLWHSVDRSPCWHRGVFFCGVILIWHVYDIQWTGCHAGIVVYSFLWLNFDVMCLWLSVDRSPCWHRHLLQVFTRRKTRHLRLRSRQHAENLGRQLWRTPAESGRSGFIWTINDLNQYM